MVLEGGQDLLPGDGGTEIADVRGATHGPQVSYFNDNNQTINKSIIFIQGRQDEEK